MINRPFNYSLIADQEQFIGREEEIKEIVSGIVRGIKYSIFGQRRIGKTSIAFRLKKILESEYELKKYVDLGCDKYKVVYCDCGTISNERDIWKKIFKEIGVDDTNFSNLSYGDIEDILKRDSSRKLIIFDEFEVIAMNTKIPEKFYSFLRSLSSIDLNINYIVIGKYDINAIETMYNHLIGSPFFTIFTKYNIRALKKGDCMELLKKGFNDATNDNSKFYEDIINYVGNSPYFLNRLGSLYIDNKYEPTDIEKVFKEFDVIVYPIYCDMISRYDLNVNKPVFIGILEFSFMPEGVLKRKFMEESIIKELTESKVGFISESFEKFIRNSIM